MRIGTHRGDGQLLGRLREHFVHENKDRSIFRKNIGRALLNRDHSPLLAQWELDLTTREAREKHGHRVDHAAMGQIETQVSRYIHEKLSFCVIPVPDKEARMRFEAGLIATVNACSRCCSTSHWLGNHSPKHRIRQSGLWLVQGLDSEPLSCREWQAIKQGATEKLSKPIAPPKKPRLGRRGRPTGGSGKYEPLTKYLRATEKDHVKLSFQQLEEILGFELPNSARKYRPWWANQKTPYMSPQSRAWQTAGFIIESVNPAESGSILFRRIDCLNTGLQTSRERK